MDAITVLIVDDHTIAREGLRAMLETDEHISVVGDAADGQEALERVSALRPKIVLMDIRMPRMDGLEATRRIKHEQPTTSVVIMTSYDDDALVVDAVRAGASGYLLKDSSRALLLHTIGAAASGGILIKAALLRRAVSNLAEMARPQEAAAPPPTLVEPLTQREQEVLKLLADGCTNKEIGDKLALAEVTIKKHVQSIIAKLAVSDRTHAATVAIRMGIIS